MDAKTILEEALRLPLSKQEEIATQLSYHILGELQALGFEECSRQASRPGFWR
jgi:hypothetical protein